MRSSPSPSGSATWIQLSIQPFTRSSTKTFVEPFGAYCSSDVCLTSAVTAVSHVQSKKLLRRRWWGRERHCMADICDIISKGKSKSKKELIRPGRSSHRITVPKHIRQTNHLFANKENVCLFFSVCFSANLISALSTNASFLCLHSVVTERNES